MISAQGEEHALGSSVSRNENAALPDSNRGVGPAHWQPRQCTAQWLFMLAEIFVAEESVHLTIEPGSAVNKDVLQLAEWADW